MKSLKTVYEAGEFSDVLRSSHKRVKVTVGNLSKEAKQKLSFQEIVKNFPVTHAPKPNKKLTNDYTDKIDPSINQKLRGTVKRITNYGAFVKIKPFRDGLLHNSEIPHQNTSTLSVGAQVTVWVKGVDAKKRISLTMKESPKLKYSDIQVNDIFEGEVKRIENYGTFVDIGLERAGLIIE